ncbi:hypothetical protein [Paenibacillus sp. Soil750]|uniref:hypothetical protein n=1 Tax=Paenibacillus sp. Soil750 TaxID=1736398 RepID=UPI0006F5378B|nr:hypothetical protein [Paenibacillus sp. Soil750]KRE64783.1 hypothetical protein ASL11_22240 [Paenibacillus sp. Soil750]
MKNMIPLGLLLLLLMLIGCGDKGNGADTSVSSLSPMPAASESPPSSTPVSSPLVTEANSAIEDDSIRAIGTHLDGRLLVKPANKASVAPLGAPSCYGMETDLHWTGDYEAIWESKSEGIATPISTFPIDFEIVQQNDSPFIMQPFTLEDMDIFAYVPRYTDCHGLETYLFGVSNRTAFPITFEIEPGVNWASISQLPHHPFKVANGEFIVTGGYGAGQDFINVYHFRYDTNKKSMILKSTNQVKPIDI